MPTRIRQRVDYESGNRIYKPTGDQSFSLNRTEFDRTTDVTHEGDNQNFEVVSERRSGGTISGTESSDLTGYIWNNYHCTYQTDDPYATQHADLDTLDWDILALNLLKRTSPSRSSLDSIVSLVELRELPGTGRELYGIAMDKLFKFIPRKAFRALGKAAKLNLIVQFGLLPIYGDIQKLLQFQSLVDKRVKEIERLKTNGLRRSIHLFSDSAVESLPATLQSSGVVITSTVEKRTVRTVRGHARWYVSDNFSLSDSQIRKVVSRDIIGLRLDPKTLYELIPWSWLVDWFTNLGDFVSLSRNSFSAWHVDPRIMVHTSTETYSKSTDVGGVWDSGPIWTGFRNTFVTKERFRVTPSLSAQLPFLTNGQMSILGSLAVIRSLR